MTEEIVPFPANSKMVNLTGKRFGRLFVVGFAGYFGPKKAAKWLCRCDCGNKNIVVAWSLSSGDTKSCGCLHLDTVKRTSKKHGLSQTTEYKSWAGMKERCLNKNNPAYSRYGGRGIKVCDRWLKFENFYADMGEKPTPGHSIDRHPDNNGNYEPSNCRWATIHEQNMNTRSVANSLSGVAGVNWRRDTNKWSAIIRFNGRTYHLGCFSGLFDAICARKSAEAEHFKR